MHRLRSSSLRSLAYCSIMLSFLSNFIFLAILLGIRVESFASPMRWHDGKSSSTSISYSSGYGPVVVDINSPDDLKDFVLADDRLAVIKVYADWCKTCRKFDLRYRKVACTWGDTNAPYGFEGSEFSNLVRFSQMEYGANEEMCKLLDATKLPYILIYKRESGKMAGFTCPPSKSQLLVDALHKYALPQVDDLTSREEADSANYWSKVDRILAEGVDLMQYIMPEIQEEDGYAVYTNPSSFD